MDKNTKIFIVEDDPVYARLLNYLMSMDPEHEIYSYDNGKMAISNLEQLNPDIVLLDYSLPDMLGIEVLRRIMNFREDINVIIFSGQQEINVVIGLLKSGAYDYIIKNEDAKDRILTSVRNAKSKLRLIKEINSLQQHVEKKYSFENYVLGNSRPMQQVFGLLNKAITNNITVSIYGETGTGKEVVAKAIHFNSKRKKEPFVAINMSAIPKELIESELFGHEKGAFTGASQMKKGKFEIAHGGTLFLDEIGELDIHVQAKLLRALQEREIVRVGGHKPIKYDVRIISATHRNLKDQVKDGKFREDLYYRIMGLTIELPPLRDRGEDVILLANHFLLSYTKSQEISSKTFSKEAKKAMRNYHWPGNVRELRAVVELAAVMSDGDEITANDFEFNELRTDNLFDRTDLTLDDYKCLIINHFMKQMGGDVLAVAKKLDIGKSTIYRLINDGRIEQ